MKIKIKTIEQFMEQINDHGLRAAASTQLVCLSIFERFKAEGEDVVSIWVHGSLVSRSYTTNPSMFSNTLAGKSVYKFVQSFKRGEYIVVQGSVSKKPVTFKKRALMSLKKRKEFQCLRGRVPASYRRRPGLLSRALSLQLEQPIAIIANKKRIIWKVAVDN